MPENKAISLAATAAVCLATVLLGTGPLSSHGSTLHVLDGSPSVSFSAQHGQTRHLRLVFPKSSLPVYGLPVSSYFQAFVFHHGSQGGMAGRPKHSALAQQSEFSLPGQQKQAETGCHGVLGKIPSHRLVCSHPPHTQQEIFGFCRISLILRIFISLKLSLVTWMMTHTNISHTLHCV